MIGPPGSGKTTALRPVRAALSARPRRASCKGVGGTRNCDWFFTDEAVLIDTAGRYTSQDSDRDGGRRGMAGLPRSAEASDRPAEP